MALLATYWNSKGKYQVVCDLLGEMVPDSGPVTGSKNRALEKYRKACNCYYDLYNNGLINRATSFAKVFKIPASQYRIPGTYGRFGHYLYVQTEDVMNDIIVAAALEQYGELLRRAHESGKLTEVAAELAEIKKLAPVAA